MMDWIFGTMFLIVILLLARNIYIRKFSDHETRCKHGYHSWGEEYIAQSHIGWATRFQKCNHCTTVIEHFPS